MDEHREEPTSGGDLISALAVTAAVAGLGFAVFIGVERTSTMGATRSARLRWERRAQEIAEVVREEQAVQAASETGPDE